MQGTQLSSSLFVPIKSSLSSFSPQSLHFLTFDTKKKLKSHKISPKFTLRAFASQNGQGQGFDIDLIKLISDAVSIPVIASSGAGTVEHFSEVFTKTNASAALAAGIFHQKEVPIQSVKERLLGENIEVRI